MNDLNDYRAWRRERRANAGATELWRNKRMTLDGRMERAAEIVASKPGEAWCIWVETNPEADKIRALLTGAVEVRGDEPLDTKRDKLRAFSRGDERVLITKLDIAGFGINWQHCHNTVFASLTYSFERVYQGLKRFHRYGQTHPFAPARKRWRNAGRSDPNPRKSSLSKGAIMRKDWTSPSDWQASPEAVKYASRKRIRSCAKCGGSRDVPGQRYCRRCRAAYMREHRAKRKQTHITISRMEYEALRNRST